MSDKELIEYMRNINAEFKHDIVKGTIEMLTEYYNLCEELMARGINAIQENQRLIQENQDLEERLNVLDYENKQLKEELEKIKQPKIFIDTEDIEERYGEQLYQDYLKEQLDLYKSVIDEVQEELSYMSTDCYVEDYDIKDKHYEMLMNVLSKVKEDK